MGSLLVVVGLAWAVSVAVVLQAWRTGTSLVVAFAVVAVVVTNAATLSVDEPAGLLVSLALGSWVVLLAVFPDGVPRPSAMGWLLVAVVVAFTASSLASDPAMVRVPAFVVGVAGGGAAQVWRYQRRSSTRERQCAKWLLAGLVPAVVLFVGGGVLASTTSLGERVFDADAYLLLSAICIWLVPLGAAAGLIVGERGRIDDLLRVELVACSTASISTWAYFLVVPRLGTTAAAAVAAALVVPVSRSSGRFADRLVYGRGAALALPSVTQRLQSTLVVDDVGSVVTRSITGGLNVPYAAVRLGHGELLAADGVPTAGAPRERFPVRYLGELVAEIEVEPRTAEVTLHRRDRTTLASLAAHAGPALHGVQAQRHIADAYRRLELAREEERERIRFDLHDDLAPTLAGLGLRAAAAAAIETTEPERAHELRVEVREGLRDAVAQVREIAHDLRPTIPEGLVPALSRRLAIEQDDSLEISIDATGPLGELSSEVELAVLRIVQEAVTNVRRHASASRCDVRITCCAQEVRVSVTDDGRGITHDARPSIGLVSLEHRATSLGGRLTISDTDGGGTTVVAVLPLGDGTAP